MHDAGSAPTGGLRGGTPPSGGGGTGGGGSDKVSNHLNGDYASEWQTLVLQVSSSGIYSYVNGVLLTEHKALKYLPETDQFIYFNIWFDQLDRTKTTSRTYHQDVDWVYFAEDALLLPSEVTARVASFRASSTTRKDTVN